MVLTSVDCRQHNAFGRARIAKDTERLRLGRKTIHWYVHTSRHLHNPQKKSAWWSQIVFLNTFKKVLDKLQNAQYPARVEHVQFSEGGHT